MSVQEVAEKNKVDVDISAVLHFAVLQYNCLHYLCLKLVL